PVALALTFHRSGRVTILAEPDLVANRALKETDAGLVVLPWFLEDGTQQISFDEYDQGFRRGGSLWKAAGTWLLMQPAGWMLLQVTGALLMGLVLMALRFGPTLTVVERHRRSPLEHVDALAAGLER